MQKNTLAILAVAIAMALAPAAHAAGPKKSPPPAAAGSHAPVSEAARAAHDFYERLLKGPTGKPGVWVDVESGDITRYSKSGSTYIDHTTSVSADGTVRPEPVTNESVDDATGAVTVTNEGRRFKVEYAREPNDTFRLTIVREPRKEGDRTLVQVVRFAGDGMETTLNARTSHGVWRSEAAALEHQTAVAKLRASQGEVKRTQERLAALKAEAQQREMEDDIRRREAEEAEQQSQIAQREGEDEAAHAQWEAESRRSSQELEDSLQRLRDSTAEYEAVVKRLTGAQAPASTGNPAGWNAPGGRETSERVEASLGTGSDGPSARQGASTGANSESARLGQPLKFKLVVGLEPKPGDTANPNCVSTLITRGSPGPGWGSSEFNSNNASNYAKAQAEVERVKRQFFIACGASGRTVREGDFRWEWNQTSSDLLDRMGARNGEDVTVDVP